MRSVFLATTVFSLLSAGICVCADAAATEAKSAKERLARRSNIFVLQLFTTPALVTRLTVLVE